MAKKKTKEKEPKRELSRTAEILKKIQVGSEFEDFTVADANKIENIPTIPSGLLSVDLILGGGYPQGRIVELFGSEGSGKTTLALQAVASAQSRGGVGAFVDVEHAVSLPYAQELGVDVSRLLFGQPDSGEKALSAVEAFCENMQPGDIIVVDSVANLVPELELKGEMGDQHVGLQARMMSQAMRRLTAIVSRSGATVIFINQLRHKIGVIYGSNETTTGGRALKFYASQRIEVKPAGRIKGPKDEIVGQKVRLKVVKNKIAMPFKEEILELYFGSGFSRTKDLLQQGVENKIISKNGAWYYYGDNTLGQGSDKAAFALSQYPDVMSFIEKTVLEKHGIDARSQ